MGKVKIYAKKCDIGMSSCISTWQGLERALSQLEESGVFYSTKEFECPICFDQVAIGDGIILQDCLHMFCR